MTEYSAIDQPPVDEPGAGWSAASAAGSTDEAAPPSYGDGDLAARYGVKGGMSRTRKITLGVVGIALLAGAATYIGWNEAHPKVQATVLSFTTDDNSITVKFEVDKPSDEVVECTLTAEDVKGAVVGTANVPVMAGRAKTDVQTTVNTTSTPNTVIVSSCVEA
jgi:Domain of unknown function (DUF4307)